MRWDPGRALWAASVERAGLRHHLGFFQIREDAVNRCAVAAWWLDRHLAPQQQQQRPPPPRQPQPLPRARSAQRMHAGAQAQAQQQAPQDQLHAQQQEMQDQLLAIGQQLALHELHRQLRLVTPGITLAQVVAQLEALAAEGAAQA